MKPAETRTVRSQAEFDQALADKAATILIDSPKAVRIVIDASGDSAIEVQGESTIQSVGGSATIQRVGGSATIQRVWDSATIQSVGGSATIQRVGGSATIQSVGGSATIQRVGDSATIQSVWGSATIQSVGGSATIQSVWDSATIQSVWGSAMIHLYDRSRAPKIGAYATAYIHSGRATFDPTGRIVDLTQLNLNDARTWCEYNSVNLVEVDGRTMATLYKAVNADLVAGESYNPTIYEIGSTVTASDWRPTQDCGYGLHLCAEPAATLAYRDGDGVRYLECSVDLVDMVTLEDKVKVRTLTVVREVGMGGQPVSA